VKILVADDDLELRGLIAYALRQAGYLVVEAGDGAAALELFDREEPVLVILDVNMPRLSGLEVCRRLREISKVPVMMLTVRSGEEDQVQALDLGADDYLTKPFSPRSLLARVRALLRRAGAEKPAPVAAGGSSPQPASSVRNTTVSPGSTASTGGRSREKTPCSVARLGSMACIRTVPSPARPQGRRTGGIVRYWSYLRRGAAGRTVVI